MVAGHRVTAPPSEWALSAKGHREAKRTEPIRGSVPPMPVIRLLLRLGALVLILVLGACGSPASNQGELPTTQTHAGISVHPPDMFASLHSRKMTEKPLPLLLPVRLVIPAIAINASIESVGIQADNELATPPHHPWEDVGWYDLGPLPSERGSAVID